MPLTMAPPGELNYIKKVGGGESLRAHLASMGFVAGAGVVVVSRLAGNVILNVKDTRVAIDAGIAKRIMI